jgi:hypothetical protein
MKYIFYQYQTSFEVYLQLTTTYTTKRVSMNCNVIFILFYLTYNLIHLPFSTKKESTLGKVKTEKIINTKSKSYLMIQTAYDNLKSSSCALPKFESFAAAFAGYQSLQEKGLVKKQILTLIDFGLSSNTKRLWVIDLANHAILFHTLVAHGKNTGEEYATQFSNKNDSFQSSLGFYSTGEIYHGKHGLSLKLDGLEKGINCNARARAIVIHGADYVSEKFIKENKRLGRSLGCPALPKEINLPLINAIKDQSILFIYHPSRKKEEKNDALTS